MSNLAGRVRFSLMSTRDFEDGDLAAKIVNLLLSLPPNVRPDMFDAYEPLKRKVASAADVVDLLINEGSPRVGQRSGLLIMKRRNDAGYQVHWRKTSRPGFSAVSGRLMHGVIDKDKSVVDTWLRAIRNLVEAVSPVYGEIRSVFGNESIPFNLQTRLPDVPPISIYGEEYVALFGRSRIEQAPFLEVSRTAEGYWLVAHNSVLENVPDAKRSEIRSYLGDDAFMADGRWKYKDGRAPIFDLSNSLCRE
jgi:hypothetical protein